MHMALGRIACICLRWKFKLLNYIQVLELTAVIHNCAIFDCLVIGCFKQANTIVACKIPLLARRTRPKGYAAVGQARRATIGYLV